LEAVEAVDAWRLGTQTVACDRCPVTVVQCPVTSVQ